ncbi:glycosyltransferase [Arthrobacter sp. FW306-04-A]|uniref:glycosyltransferase n=1 Tax=Arthrobacter sp. FW306-04-A TaxID=2879619 RepID=UPI0037C1A243|nr:glycosyltransferase [Arthrobacter sp. FW306-04-A]
MSARGRHRRGRRRHLDAGDLARLGLSGWVGQLGAPVVEPVHSKLLARIGGTAAAAALVLYVCWRVVLTMPAGGPDLVAAWVLVVFEALPIGGVILNVVTLWNIDSRAPAPVRSGPGGMRVAVLIPTYNEPVEVLAPTVAAACALDPFHETWVLDDGGRGWVKDMCAVYGARFVDREHHDHAKAGNMNHALALMAEEEKAGAPAIGIIAVLDCDHVPLPTFLTATLGWFEDPDTALVQGPQAFYNAGAFDDDGITGEQGLFFNVQMRARNAAGAGPFWCGSTSLLRLAALREAGGVATETITEDMHTTLKLIRLGWKPCTTTRPSPWDWPRQRRNNTFSSAGAGAWAPCRSSPTNGFGPPNGGCPGGTSTNTSTARSGGSKGSPRSSPSSSRCSS